jgi:hypothetical protein
MPPKQKAKIVKDVTQLVLGRRTRMCNFLEYKGLHPFLWLRTYGPQLRLSRHEGRISALCVPVLCNGRWPVGQRARDAGDNPQIRGGAGPIFWERALCVVLFSFIFLDELVRSASWICEFFIRGV